MNLTLIPIAALLFLLTGFAAPANLPGQRGTAATLMHRYLRRDGIACVHASFDGLLRRATSPRDRRLALRRTRGLAGQTLAAAIPRTADHKRYTTRFGFAEGTYLAIGPPSVTPRVALG